MKPSNGDVKEGGVPTYSEAFPPLAGSASPTEIANSLAENEWLNPKMKKIRSSVVTQVLFHQTCFYTVILYT